ncbi:MAG: hypothetical protein IT356_05985 [Gemmatimonadaceae bacterium]|nr:hypothetical protein [Gemmatimonadaceae bacterium]
MTNKTRYLAAVCLFVASFACSRDRQAGVPLGKVASADAAQPQDAAHSLIGPAALAALDTGNTLFRKQDYAGALAKYRTAGDLAPQHSAPIFGIYMVAKAMGNKALADSALAAIRDRNGPLPEAGHGMSDSALKALHARSSGRGTNDT